ncbi:MAG: hypothetical protein Q9219_002579 [cf. Caloplaca sp. 3 TL-2023]
MDRASDMTVDGTIRNGSQARKHDPVVSDLFSSSLGPVTSVRPVVKHPLLTSVKHRRRSLSSSEPDHDSGPSRDAESKKSENLQNPISSAIFPLFASNSREAPQRRRKRNRDGDDIEGRYFQRLANLEPTKATQKENMLIDKRRRLLSMARNEDKDTVTDMDESSFPGVRNDVGEVNNDSDIGIFQHESLTPSKEVAELEKAARTVFLGNVSTLCIKSKPAKKALLSHLSSFCSMLPAAEKPHKVQSIRFRSTPFAAGAGPRKAAYAKRELMDSTTKSTNAYAVYTSQLGAREAVTRLNGTTILDRHLLVDHVTQPRKTDYRRCVFIGNLGFVDDESQIDATRAENKGIKPRRPKEPSDVEEGLWRQFSIAGAVESIRVIRDGKTRVGKGFAYVQFRNEVAVEKALLFNNKRFPPLLPRIMRVTRARKTTKTAMRTSQHSKKDDSVRANVSGTRYTPKIDPVAQPLSARVSKLYGRAGAAGPIGRTSSTDKQSPKGFGGIATAPERMVFEGNRASSKQGRGAKSGGSGKKQARQGKPQTRSSRRGAAFKVRGGMKSGTRA